MDEARFGLKVWPRRRRWCPAGNRPPWQVEDRYEWTCLYAWTWLYAAAEPATGESFCLYMSHLNGDCFEVFLEVFLEKLRERYPDEEIVLVLDGAGAHRSTDVSWPDGVEAMQLPAYSPDSVQPRQRTAQTAYSPDSVQPGQRTARS